MDGVVCVSYLIVRIRALVRFIYLWDIKLRRIWAGSVFIGLGTAKREVQVIAMQIRLCVVCYCLRV